MPSGPVSAIAAGEAHTCAAINTGSLAVTCVGDNRVSQLGEGMMPGSYTSLCAGRFHTCGVRNPGVLECWGQNTAAQTVPSSATPAFATPTEPFTNTMALQAVCGAAFSCLRSGSSHELRCWGSNSNKQIESSTSMLITTPTPALSGILPVAAGWAHMCFGFGSGTSCRGDDTGGQSSGTPSGQVQTAEPVANTPLEKPQAIAAGAEFTCAVYDGGVWCWGTNDAAQLGRLGSTMGPLPVIMGR